MSGPNSKIKEELRNYAKEIFLTLKSLGLKNEKRKKKNDKIYLVMFKYFSGVESWPSLFFQCGIK